MNTKTIEIPTFRIVPAITGIGWVAVQRWVQGRYEHVSTFRCEDEAQQFIDSISE